MKTLTKTLKSEARTGFGLVVPAGSIVVAEYHADGSDLVKCKNKEYGVFYTVFHNLL